MKYLILMLCLFSILQGGMFSTLEGLGMKEIKPDYTYTIDTAGINPRIYEWTPKSNPNITCIVIFGNSKAAIPAMQCFPKNNKNKTQ